MIAATLAASLFLPVGLMATQITISQVSAQRDGGRLSITVKGDAMIDPDTASAKLGDGHLYLYIPDARVREANRSWPNGAAEGADDIRAHRHRERIELAVPLADSGCQGSVELQKLPEGLRALIDCEEAPRPAAGRVVRPQAVARTEPRAEPKPEPKLEPKFEPKPESQPEPGVQPRAERPISVLRVEPGAPRAEPSAVAIRNVPGTARLSDRDATALRAKLALEPAKNPPAGAESESEAQIAADKALQLARPPVVVAAPVVAAPVVAAPVVAAPVVAAPVGTAPAVAAVLPLVTATPPGEARAQSAPASGGGGSGTGSGVVLAGLALLAIAGGAFFFSRRRTLTSRHIRIIETASLGPKRAIIMARIGDATMILGSSEAGITLLQTLPLPHADIALSGAALAGIALPGVALPGVGQTDLPQADLSDSLSASFFASTPSLEIGGPGVSFGDAAPNGKIEVSEAPGITSADDTDGDEVPPVGQAGLLARLFRRGTPANDPMPRFEDLLEDSFEDQELRRKLALGISARVR